MVFQQQSLRREGFTAKSEMNMQDVFLNHCRKKRTPVLIQLSDQSQQHGEIIGFDSKSIVLESAGCQLLIYKSAIVLINPQEQVNFIFRDNHRHLPSDPGPEYPTNLS